MDTNNKENHQSIAKNLADIAGSRFFKIVILAVLALAVLAGVFSVGISVGYHKAKFSYSWGENYHTNFGGPKGGFMRQLPPPLRLEDDFINSNGTAGSIIKIDGDNLIISGNDNVEKTIVVTDKTTIIIGRQNIKVADLKVGDLTVTIGSPNDSGQIEAKLIRIFKTQQ